MFDLTLLIQWVLDIGGWLYDLIINQIGPI